jgi:hypothetical protein
MKKYFIVLISFGLIQIFSVGFKSSSEIKVNALRMTMSKGSQTFKEELLHGEIANTRIEHIAYAGPISKKIVLANDSTNMFLFIKGKAMLQAGIKNYNIVPETIALPFSINAITLNVPKGDTLHFVLFTKKLSEQDLIDLKNFPA